MRRSLFTLLFLLTSATTLAGESIRTNYRDFDLTGINKIVAGLPVERIIRNFKVAARVNFEAKVIEMIDSPKDHTGLFCVFKDVELKGASCRIRPRGAWIPEEYNRKYGNYELGQETLYAICEALPGSWKETQNDGYYQKTQEKGPYLGLSCTKTSTTSH